ncbi:GDP-mannose 4,6-dehydratase [Micromonospora sp. NPDC007208]|uniref:GDP-mannose 4,6-dehydratase n=1 Tax=Micromonospora sp. NPDC007208 TaxID=3364236 RepID=UPI0036A93206
MSRVASNSGFTGQDGSYLSGLLLNKGNTVHGLKRISSSFNTGRIDRISIHPRQSGADLNDIDLKLVVGRLRVTAAALDTRSGRA